MANFFADLGRSKAVTRFREEVRAGETSDQNLAVSKSALARAEATHAQTSTLNAQKIAENNMILKKKEEEDLRLNTPHDVDAVLDLPTLMPGTREKMKKDALDMGLIKEINGRQTITVKNRDLFIKSLQENTELATTYVQSQVEGVTLEMQQLQAGLANGEIKKPEDVQNAKNRIEDLQTAQRGMNREQLVLEALKSGKYTADSIAEYRKTLNEADLDEIAESSEDRAARELSNIDARLKKTETPEQLATRQQANILLEQTLRSSGGGMSSQARALWLTAKDRYKLALERAESIRDLKKKEEVIRNLNAQIQSIFEKLTSGGAGTTSDSLAQKKAKLKALKERLREKNAAK